MASVGLLGVGARLSIKGLMLIAVTPGSPPAILNHFTGSMRKATGWLTIVLSFLTGIVPALLLLVKHRV